MKTGENTRRVYMIVVVSLMFLVAAGVTVAAGFLIIEKNRGFLFWLTVGFLLLVELVAYVFSLGLLTSALRTNRVSTPIVVSSWVVLAVYTFVGMASITIYALIRNADKPADKFFGAVLMVQTALAFLMVLLLRSWDLFFQASQPSTAQHREDHRAEVLTLQPLLGRLRAVRWPEPLWGTRMDKVLKRLEVVQSALLHSHGGGVGSREAGHIHTINPVVEGQITAILVELEAVVAGLETGTDTERNVKEVESLAGRLQGFVSALQLD